MQAWGSKGLHMLATLSQRDESINTYMTNTYMTNTYTLLISYYASEPASGRRIIATYQLVANSLSRQAIKCSHAKLPFQLNWLSNGSYELTNMAMPQSMLHYVRFF